VLSATTSPRRRSTPAVRPIFSAPRTVAERLTVCTTVHTVDLVELEWDGDKAASNLKNHGVDFADAATVLLDDMAITIRDDSSHEEERFVTLGMDATARLLVVVYTWRRDILRLISARPATTGERRRYESKR